MARRITRDDISAGVRPPQVPGPGGMGIEDRWFHVVHAWWLMDSENRDLEEAEKRYGRLVRVLGALFDQLSAMESRRVGHEVTRDELRAQGLLPRQVADQLTEAARDAMIMSINLSRGIVVERGKRGRPKATSTPTVRGVVVATRYLARRGFSAGQIALVLDDGEGGDRTMRRDRAYRRLERSPGECDESVEVGPAEAESELDAEVVEAGTRGRWQTRQ